MRPTLIYTAPDSLAMFEIKISNIGNYHDPQVTRYTKYTIDILEIQGASKNIQKHPKHKKPKKKIVKKIQKCVFSGLWPFDPNIMAPLKLARSQHS